MQVLKIDANSTGLRYAKEVSLGVLPANPVWNPAEPNSYKSFGASYKKVSRAPISASRQQSKGITVDQDAAGGIQQDLTSTNMLPFIEGLMYASLRSKNAAAASGVDANGYDVFNGASYHAGDIVFGYGFAIPANNGAKIVTGSAAGSVAFAGSQPDGAGNIVRVGVKLAAGDATIDVSGTFPTLKTTAYDLTQLGVIPGEWLYIGGDAGDASFANANNNGFARVRSVSAHALAFDKTSNVMAADGGAGKSLVLYFGRVIKNEHDPMLQVRSTYTFERTLGAPDNASAAQQAEYLEGCGINEWVLTLNTADKITYEASVVATNYETVDANTGLKAGSRPSIVDGLAYNSTLNVKRAGLGIYGSGASLFAYLSVGAVTINNNIKPNKAIGVLGAFDTSAGIFAVSATATAYFTNVAALAAVKNNADCSFDLILAAGNKGIALDLPLVSLGENGLNVTSNEAVTVPLTMDAASGAPIDPNLDHTALFVFFDYLPNRAM